MTQLFDCFDNIKCLENGEINYTRLTVKGLLNPAYLTNITIFLTIYFIFTKNIRFINNITPLLFTNGFFISLYTLFYLKKFDIESLKYICPVEVKDPKYHKRLLEITNTKTFVGFYKYSQPFVHFWPILLIYYLGYYKKPKKTNLLESILFNLIVCGIYGCIIQKDRYGFVIKNEDIVNCFFLFILLLFITSYIFFYILPK